MGLFRSCVKLFAGLINSKKKVVEQVKAEETITARDGGSIGQKSNYGGGIFLPGPIYHARYRNQRNKAQRRLRACPRHLKKRLAKV